MQVVLLAAGMGLRLGDLTKELPKALVPLNDKALIDYTLPILLDHPAVSQVVVVGGFGFDLVCEHLQKYSSKKLILLENKAYQLGNIFTLKTAQPYLTEDFLLTNVDHVFSKSTWDEILQARVGPTIFCEFKRALLDDEMKIKLKDDCLLEMSKTLTDFDGGYIGLTYIPKPYLTAYQQAMETAIATIGEKAVVENILPILARNNVMIKPHSLDYHKWSEVDTVEDLKVAEQKNKAQPITN